jgi:hypothetical protein
LQKPHEILASDQLQAVTINPLSATFQTPKGERNQTILSYFGVGTDAAGAVAITEAKPALRRLTTQHPLLGPVVHRLREPSIVLPPACISPTFDITGLDDPQHPQSRAGIMEWLVGNGSRMARYGRFPTDLTTTEVSIAAVQASGPLRAPSVLLNGLKLTRAALPFDQHDMTQGSRSWEIQNIAQKRSDAPLFAQWDGETSQVSEGKVTIASTCVLRALTTKAPTPTKA